MSRTKNDYGTLLASLSRFEEAEQAFAQCLASDEECLGKSHPNNATTLFNLGELEKKRKNFSKAIEYFESARSVLQDSARPNLVLQGRVMHAIAATHCSIGRFEQAQASIVVALGDFESTLGTEDELYLKSQILYFRIIYNLRRLQDAYDGLTALLDRQKTIFGEDHDQIAESSGVLSLICMDLGKLEDAARYLKIALKIWSRSAGRKSSDFNVTLNNLGEVHRKMGRYSEAESFLQLYLEWVLETLGEQTEDYAVAMNNLGLVFLYTNRLSAASRSFKSAVCVSAKLLGVRHPYTIQFKKNLKLCRRLFLELTIVVTPIRIIASCYRYARNSMGLLVGRKPKSSPVQSHPG